MNLIKKIASIVILTLFVSQAYAQISLGGQASYLNMFGGTGLKNVGAGLKVDFAKSDRFVLSGGLTYYLPSKFTESTYGNATDNFVDPQQILIDVEQKVSFMHITLDGKLYVVGDYESSLGLYGILGVGALVAPVTTSLGSYDTDLYYTSYEDGQKETLSNFTLNFGCGVEKEVGFGFLFADAKLNLPANQANGMTVAVEIPTTLSLSVGVRVPL